MEIQQLPPQPNPKQETAHQAPRTLHEHLLAFLCANNQSGFMDEQGLIGDYTKFAKRPDYEVFSIDKIQTIDPNTVIGLMLDVAAKKEIDYRKTLHYGYEIKEASGRKIKLYQAQIIVARLLGYYNFDALYRELLSKYRVREIPKDKRHEFMVDNRRDRAMLYMQFLEQANNQQEGT